MKKSLVTLSLLILVIFFSISTTFANTPGQVLKSVGIIKGDDTGLNESALISREEMITILSRIHPTDKFEVFTYSGKSSFKDVSDNHWAAPYIQFAKEKGITSGINVDEFGLGQNITGRQAIIFMARILGYTDAGNYYSNISELEKKMQTDITSISIDQYDKEIKRHDVFNLLIEALNTKHLKFRTPLKYMLNVNIDKEPLKELNNISNFDFDYKELKLTSKELNSRYSHHLTMARDFSNRYNKKFKDAIIKWKSAKSKEVLYQEETLEIINSNTLIYKGYELSKSNNSNGIRDDLETQIVLDIGKLLREGKVKYQADATDGTNNSTLEYITTEKVGKIYYIFLKSEEEISVIIINKSTPRVEVYVKTPYGVGQGFYTY